MNFEYKVWADNTDLILAYLMATNNTDDKPQHDLILYTYLLEFKTNRFDVLIVGTHTHSHCLHLQYALI